MKIFPYETSERPPAPYLDLRVRPSVQRRRFLPQRAKLDSGASMTVIPNSLVVRWGLIPHSAVAVRGYNRRLSIRPAYVVDLEIGKKRFAQIKVTVSPRDNVLLGRDVLNQLKITLDGPSRMTEIHDV